MPVFSRYGFFLVLFLGLFASVGKNQTLPPKITSYTPDQYKGHGQIYCTEGLAGGWRAFGTASEVLIHNGESFLHVRVGSGRHVHSMDRDRSGRIFIGGNSLMGVITPDSTGSMSFHSLQSLLPDSLLDYGSIWDVHCDQEGGVYFDALDHLFYYDGDTVKLLDPKNHFFLMHRPSDRLVIEDNDSGLFAISGRKKSYLPGSDTLAKKKGVHAVLPAYSGDTTVWTVFTRSHGIYRYLPSTGKVGRMKAAKGNSHRELRKAKIYTATRLDTGSNPYGAAYAVGTELNGLYLLGPKGRILIQLGMKDGLPARSIWQVRTDGAGNIWAGTNDGIALLQTGLPFTMLGEGALFSGSIKDISRGSSTRGDEPEGHYPLFLATSQGAWMWKDGERTFSRVRSSEGQCFDIHPFSSPNGSSRMLIATDVLLSVPAISKGKEGPISPDTISRNDPYALAEFKSSQGMSVLEGGRKKLQVVSPSEGGGHWKKLLSLEAIPEGIQSVGFDPLNGKPDSIRFWAGMPSKGVLAVTTDTAFSGHRIEHYDSSDGLPEGNISVFPDPFGKEEKVLFGSVKGIHEFENGKFIPFCRYGQIFCDSSRQIFRFETGPGKEVWVNDATKGQIKHLIPEEEGYRIDSLLFYPLDFGTIRAIFPEEDRTWLGGDQGLACYYPDLEVDLERTWHCRLREVRGSGDSLLFGGTFSKKAGGEQIKADSTMLGRVPVKEQPDQMRPELPYSKNRMKFSFAAVFPIRQKAVTYSYKLVGFDTSWSKWTKEAKKEYTNLPEGNYTFKVKARNVYLKESKTTAYRFRILPPWYRTTGAYAGYTVTGALILALIAWLWIRKRRADKQAREYLEGLEKANVEIREEKDKVEEAHQEITQSIEYAKKIQYALLQSEEYVSPHLPEHLILFKPQSQVSGDFYWGKEHGGSFYMAAVDCTGHGVPGAFMSMLGISQLNEIMNTDEVLTPGFILTELRDRLVHELSGSDPESAAKDGMDAAMVRIPLSKEGEGKSEKGEERDGEDHLQG
ncbi:MAG: triple tyrosine motif-containing protein, partial [Flavobacteriales bacterium]